MSNKSFEERLFEMVKGPMFATLVQDKMLQWSIIEAKDAQIAELKSEIRDLKKRLGDGAPAAMPKYPPQRPNPYSKVDE